MTILIGKYEFEGPYASVDKLENKPGIYAVLYLEKDEYQLVQLSQTDNVRESIELTPSQDDNDAILLAACYTENSSPRERLEMVDETWLEFLDESDPEWDRIQQTATAS